MAAEQKRRHCKNLNYMQEIFDREINLIGIDKFNILQSKTVAVFGLGGVGSFIAEGLCRAGIGKLVLCDGDKIDKSNINRQLFALNSTVGRYKTEVAKERLKDINPNVEIVIYTKRFDATTKDEFDFSGVDYIADAIDTVTSKLLLIGLAKEKDIPIISCMGTGNKLYGGAFKITDIKKTNVCPLCKVMRKELKARGITNVDVLYTEEEPTRAIKGDLSTRKVPPASISFVPSVAGLKICEYIVHKFID